MRGMFKLRSIGLGTKIISCFIAVGLVPFVGFALLGWHLTEEALQEESFKKISAIRDLKAKEVQEYFTEIDKQLRTFAQNPTIVEAMRDFKAAFKTFRTDNEIEDLEEFRGSLKTYYTSKFATEFVKQTGGSPPAILKIFQQLQEDSLALQYHYISNNPHPLGFKDKLIEATDRSAYSQVHARLHPFIRTWQQEFAYYDIFLVDSESGNIVYSVYKEIDFATSLKDGPFASTNLGQVFQDVNASERPGYSKLVDFQPYYPSYDGAASFIATPIFDKEQKIGVLIFQMPLDRTNKIMTNDNNWSEVGLGKSGEIYLVGSDFKLRSEPRLFLSKREDYLSSLAKIGVNALKIQHARNRNSTILIDEVKTTATEEALAGIVSVKVVDNKFGKSSLAAYRPLEIMGLKWAIVAQIDTAEAFISLYSFRKAIEYTLLLGLLFISFLGLLATKSISGPLLVIIGRLKEGAGKEFQASQELEDYADFVSTTASAQSQAVEHTVSSMAGFSQTLRETIETTKKSLVSAKTASEKSKSGRQLLQKMIESMKSIQQANQELGEIREIIRRISDRTDVINEIVLKTRLLSFNAYTEAARAGEDGRRFAVVAEEIGKLAESSGTASKEIQRLLKDSQKRVSEIVKTTDRRVRDGAETSTIVFSSFSEISEEIVKIASEVQWISDTALGQESEIRKAHQLVNDIENSSQQNLDAAELCKKQAVELSQQSGELTSIVNAMHSLIVGSRLKGF